MTWQDPTENCGVSGGSAIRSGGTFPLAQALSWAKGTWVLGCPRLRAGGKAGGWKDVPLLGACGSRHPHHRPGASRGFSETQAQPVGSCWLRGRVVFPLTTSIALL